MRAGMINQMHIMHTRWAGGHARQARETAINMLDGFCVCWTIILQHFLDQINTAAWAVEFISQGEISRTGRCAKTTVYAAAQNLLRMRRVAVF